MIEQNSACQLVDSRPSPQNRTLIFVASLLVSLMISPLARADIFTIDATTSGVKAYPSDNVTESTSTLPLPDGVLPQAIAVSGNDLFVYDASTGSIGQYTTAGATVNKSLITGVNLQGQAMVVSGADIFVIDASRNSVGHYTTSGATVSAALPLPDGVIPQAIAVSDNNLFVYDANSGSIGKYTTDGLAANASLVTGVNVPGHAMVVSGEDIFVVDASTNSVRDYSTITGAAVNTALALPDDVRPQAIAVSGSDLFIYDANSGNVGKYTTAGATVDSALITGVNLQELTIQKKGITFHRITSISEVDNPRPDGPKGVDEPLRPKADKAALDALPEFNGGLVADGVTPWIIKISGLTPGATYTVSIPPPSTGSIAGKTFNERLRPLTVSSWGVPYSSGATVTVPEDSDEIYVYLEGVSPEDLSFPITPNEIPALSVTVQVHAGTTDVAQQTFSIRKPPVVLVHGILSNNETWKGEFLKKLDNARGADFVLPFSYASELQSAIQDFEVLAKALDQNLRLSIESHGPILDREWAFTRYDAVGHSQGGVLLRMLCQNYQEPYSGDEAPFSAKKAVRDDNFNRGRFRRVITLGSPQNGSTLVRYARSLQLDQRYPVPYAMQILGILLKKFDPFEEQIGLINNKQYPVDSRIAFRPISSVINSLAPIYSSVELPGTDFRTGKPRVNVLLPNGADGIVNLESQIAGVVKSTLLNGISHAGPESLFSVAPGNVQTASSDAASEVVRLLDAAKVEFGSFVLPERLENDVRDEIDRLAGIGVVPTNIRSDAQSGLRARALGAPAPVESFHFHLDMPASADPLGTVNWFAEVLAPDSIRTDLVDLIVDPTNSANVEVRVKGDAEGDVVLYASYIATSGVAVFGHPIVVTSHPTAAVQTGIQIQLPETVLLEGQKLFPALFSTFDGGARKREFIGAETILDATSSNESILEVNPIGFEVVAKAPGTAAVTVKYQGFTTQAEVTVLPNPGTLMFEASTYAVDERSGAAQISVKRTGGSSGSVTVQYATSDGTAKAGSDYAYTSGELSFADGETSKVINIPILNDTVFELDETLFLTLGNVTGGATVGVERATITIQSEEAFANVKGRYTALILQTRQGAGGYGVLSLTTTGTGKVTGKLTFQGSTYPIRGQLDPNGALTTQITRRNGNALTLSIQMDDGADSFNAKLIDGTFTIDFTGDRSVFDKRRTTPYSGSYTMLLEPTQDTGSLGPKGIGYGRINVVPAGLAKVTGVLADGVKISLGMPVSKEGRLPFFAPLYGKKGIFAGYLKFQEDVESDASGTTTWERPPGQKGKLFKAGFSTSVSVSASKYVPPSKGTFLLDGLTASDGEAILTFSEGDFTSPISENILISPSGKVVDLTTSPNRTKGTISTTTGFFKGSIAVQGAKKITSFQGTVHQKQSRGAGFFLGTSQSGSVIIEAER